MEDGAPRRQRQPDNHLESGLTLVDGIFLAIGGLLWLLNLATLVVPN